MKYLTVRKTLLAAAIAAVSSHTLAAGVIEGRVSDQSGSVFFNGAIVKIEGMGLETVAEQGGRFRFSSVEAGEYTITVSYYGADTVTQTVVVKDNMTANALVKIGDDVNRLENILVVGQAAGALDALNQMRAADNVITVVSADAIGQFPDQNVAEALQRVPGVFIERDQGEGRFVGIRGIDPRLNVATINGVNLPAPENDRRNVALDVIPSDLLEGLEVTKTLTPDLDADSIGGTINIKSLSAFDRKERSYKVSAQTNYNELEDDDGYKLSGSFTDIFDVAGGELGVAFSASSAERNFGSDNVETDGGWSDEDGIRIAEEMEMRDYQVKREREGYALNLDYRANENASYYLRTLYSKFGDQEFRNRIEFKLDEGDVSFDENSLTATGTELQRELKDRFEEQEITSYSLGGENLFDRWTVEYSVSFSEAKENEPGRIDSEFEYGDVASAGYVLNGDQVSLFMSEDAYDPANFELKEFVVENNSAKDEETAFKFDIKRDMEFGSHSGYVKFGGKLRYREKNNDVNALIFEDFDEAAIGEQFLSSYTGGNLDYNFGNYGPEIVPGLQRSFVFDNISVPACQLATYDEDNCAFILDEDGSTLDSARDYRIDEDVTALYVMSRIDIDKLRLVYGLRYEQTELTLKGVNVREVDVEGQDDVQVVDTHFDKDYSQVLPSINARYQFSETLIGRAAYTQSIARPSFGDITPTPDEIEIEQDDNEIELAVEAGNPDLDPYESQNIDFSIDFYPEDLGVFSAGFFYKNIDNFIFNADVSSVADISQYSGNIAVTDAEIMQPLNGDSAELYGLELAWTRQFEGMFDGFLLMANATFTDSDADLGLEADADRSSSTVLPLQADTVGNFVVGYENYGFSLRLSTAYIGKRLAEVYLEDSANDLYEDEHTQIDFSAKYDITDNLQVFFNAVNLNEEPNRRYNGSSRYNAQYDEIGRSFALGLTYRNF